MIEKPVKTVMWILLIAGVLMIVCIGVILYVLKLPRFYIWLEVVAISNIIMYFIGRISGYSERIGE